MGRRPEQQIGSLGGGSDHVGFYCHLGIPSMSMGAGGSSGVSYHSAYDNLAWYRKVVGEDYGPAAMVTKVAQVAVARLANADVLPLDLGAFADQYVSDLDGVERRAAELGRAVEACTELRSVLTGLRETGERWRPTIELIYSEHKAPRELLDALNLDLLKFPRLWMDEGGLPERRWYRNLMVATDPYSGYGSWALPELRWLVETGKPPSWFAETIDRYTRQAAECALRAEELRQNAMGFVPKQVERP